MSVGGISTEELRVGPAAERFGKFYRVEGGVHLFWSPTNLL